LIPLEKALDVCVAEDLDPVIIQFFMVILFAPSAPVVELLLTLIHAKTDVNEEVAETILKFRDPLVDGSSPSIVTLSAPESSIMPLFADGVAGELTVTFPEGFIKTEV